MDNWTFCALGSEFCLWAPIWETNIVALELDDHKLLTLVIHLGLLVSEWILVW